MEPSTDPTEPLAERYYRLAETMNARGAIELAVPFYRQALALLLEERNQLRQLLPEHERPAFDSPSEDDLAGLLQAADLFRVDSTGDADLQPDAALEQPDLDACVAELAEDLTPDSARQVIAGLDELLLRYSDQVVPAEAHSLKGKAFILLGEVADALSCFKVAYEADAAQSRHAINYAGSLLSQSRSREALPILRSLYTSGLEKLSSLEQQALLRNLANAENQEGNLLAALQLRHQWLLGYPDALPPQAWLEFCSGSLVHAIGHELHEAAVCFLRDLHRLWPDCRPVIEALAQVLEQRGEYREAALLYRYLLRP